MLWVDKHRPLSLDKLDYHKEQAKQLMRLGEVGDLPHMLFYGPSGAGKRTRITALLRLIFGPSVERVKLEHRGFKLPSSRSIEVTTVASAHHIEMCPGDAGIYDRLVVQEVIKEMAQYNVGVAAFTAGVEVEHAGPTRRWKVLVLSEVDRLTHAAQAALRRTMEKYTATCRLILIATSPSKVIEPVRSRCLGIRVALPSQPEVMAVLASIAEKEKFTLPLAVAARIAAASGRNVRRAVLMLESAKVSSPTLAVGMPVPVMDWEKYINMLAGDIMREQSPKALLACRSKLYELVVNCIPADAIMKRLTTVITTEVGKGLPDSFKYEVVAAAAFYEHRLQLGQKDLFHMEAFIAKVMCILKSGAAGYAAAAAAAGASASR